ncbi:threonylcarbamoyladenosine tRNA methylthiotransferase CDKAL1 [Sarotherodon galilaeus]
MSSLYLEAASGYTNESYSEDVNNQILEGKLMMLHPESIGKMHVFGRNVHDFINEFDKLHEYFCFLKLQPPSFCVEEDCETSLMLHYRTTRKGFTLFVKVGRQFYNTDIEVEILKLALYPNNLLTTWSTGKKQNLNMTIMNMYCIGKGFKEIFAKPQGKKVNEEFTLVRPMWSSAGIIVFEFLSKSVVESKQKINILKLSKEEDEEKEECDEAKREEEREPKAVEEMKGADQEYSSKCSETISEDMWEPPKKPLHLKGQISPPTVEDMIKMGVYVNDLNLHDSSRADFGLNTAISRAAAGPGSEQQKYTQLQEIIKELDEEKKRRDLGLYHKVIADRLRKGITALETCQVFQDVIVLSMDVVKFSEICIPITPMQVVDILMRSTFIKHILVFVGQEKELYFHFEFPLSVQLETIMTPTWWLQVCLTKAPSMLTISVIWPWTWSYIDHIKDPSAGDNIQIRDIHSSMAVAGVAGLKMPCYCLRGDTVNTASRMESSGVTTKDHLEHKPYITEEKGKIVVKGKGYMKNYWLKGKKDLSFKPPAELRYSKGKPSPSDLPGNTLPTPKAANEPPTTSAKLQVKEEAKNTKNNKWRKLSLLQGNIMSESSSLADRLENPGPLLNNKRNSFKQDCTKLPANPLLFSVACCIL